MRVRLIAKSADGQEVLDEHGCEWNLRRIKTGLMPFNPHEYGPWWFVESVKTKDARWILSENDTDFYAEK
jgi:hypothetical protein